MDKLEFVSHGINLSFKINQIIS